jgi:archaellum component FlaG (FlaF/FlaG flagellin family)
MLKDTKANKIFLLVLLVAFVLFRGTGALRTSINGKETKTIPFRQGGDLSIKTDNDAISIMKDDAATAVTVTYKGAGKATYKTDGDDISITVSGSSHLRKNGTLYLTIPSSVTPGDLKITSTSGAIDLSELSVDGDVRLHTVSGKINLADLSAGKDISLSSTSGAIDASGLTGGNQTEIGSTSGSVSFDAYHGSDLYLHTTSGSITGSSDMKKGTIHIASTSGRVDFDLVQAVPDYHIDVKSLSGQIDVPQTSAGEGNVNVELETTSGSIVFTSQKS